MLYFISRSFSFFAVFPYHTFFGKQYEWRGENGYKDDDAQFPHRNNNFATFFCRFSFYFLRSISFLFSYFLPSSVFRASEVNHFPDDKSKKGRKNHRVRIRDFREGSGNPTVVRRQFFFFPIRRERKKRSYRISSLLQREERKYFVHFRGNKKGFFLIVGLTQLEPGEEGENFRDPFLRNMANWLVCKNCKIFPRPWTALHA